MVRSRESVTVSQLADSAISPDFRTAFILYSKLNCSPLDIGR